MKPSLSVEFPCFYASLERLVNYKTFSSGENFHVGKAVHYQPRHRRRRPLDNNKLDGRVSSFQVLNGREIFGQGGLSKRNFAKTHHFPDSIDAGN
jgi:hypothetical protein